MVAEGRIISVPAIQQELIKPIAPSDVVRPRKRVNRVASTVAVGLLRMGAFMICPGDDIAMLTAAGSGSLGQNEQPPVALIHERPRPIRIAHPIRPRR